MASFCLVLALVSTTLIKSVASAALDVVGKLVSVWSNSYLQRSRLVISLEEHTFLWRELVEESRSPVCCAEGGNVVFKNLEFYYLRFFLSKAGADCLYTADLKS
uniref:Secreted protein n=1 Tax=Romanomermis culicivorax TaxID=13658 RepID=A0A915JLP1_ROMCU